MAVGSCLFRMLPLALVGLLACGKKDAPAAAPAIRLFSNGAEITDYSVRNGFLARHAVAFAALPATGQPVVFNATGDTARFTPSTLRFSVAKSGSQYLFYSPQIVDVTSANQLLQDAERYTAPLVPMLCSNFALSGCYVTKEVRVGVRNDQQLTLSCLQYCWATYNSGFARTVYGRGILFNELNEGVAAKVARTDTLAVRAFTVVLPIQ